MMTLVHHFTKHKTTFALALCAVLVLVAGYSDVYAQVPKDVTEFTSHGVKVILRNSDANDVIGVYLGVEGGLAYKETENPAIASATAGVLSSSGSAMYPKEVYRDTMAKLSSSISGGGDLYSMNFQLRTIVPSWDRAWQVFSDMIRNPSFDPIEAQRQQQLAINAIQSRAADPDGYTNFLADSLWMGNSPLNRVAQVADVQGLTLADLQRYMKDQMQRSKMTLVVVGKVSRADIEQKLAAFEALPVGSCSFNVPRVMAPTKSAVHYVERDLPTTYFIARFPSDYLGGKDWWAERLMFEILDKRLFDEVRTKRNLSYAPGGYPNGSRKNYYGTITLQSVLPDSAHNVVIREVQKLQTQPVPTTELENAKASRLTTVFWRMQTNADQARNLYNYQIESGDWRNLFRVAELTQKVTAADIKRVANTYMRHFQYVLMGPSSAVKLPGYTFE